MEKGQIENSAESEDSTIRQRGAGIELEDVATFNNPIIWLSRLQNIIDALVQTENDAQIQLMARDYHFVTDSEDSDPFETDLNLFELSQIESLHVMVGHVKRFAQELLSRYTAGVLPPEWEDDDRPPTFLLRKAFHELSTDLQILQSALAQRLWDAVPDRAESVSSESYEIILEDLPELFNELDFLLEDHAVLANQANYKAAIAAYNAIITMGTRSSQAETLIRADILATEIFGTTQKLLAGAAWHEDNQTSIEVVTYFTQSMHVRILPYYPDIVLIGLPFASGYTKPNHFTANIREFIQGYEDESPEQFEEAVQSIIPWEFLSIPHEIGHYLFWNGMPLHEEGDHVESLDVWLKDRLVNDLEISESDWRHRWLEELFADVFNCLLFGPAAVLGLQAYLSDAAPDEWFIDNGHHPIPAIRPFVGCLILERIDIHKQEDRYNFENGIPQLVANWEAILKNHGISDELDEIVIGKSESNYGYSQWQNHVHKDQLAAFEEGDQETLSYAEIEEKLIPIIDIILEYLELERPEESAFSHLPWVDDIQPGQGVEGFSEQILAIVNVGSAAEVPARTFNKQQVDFKSLWHFGNDPEDDGPAKADDLKARYLDHWGDKGPGGNLVQGG